MTLVAEDGTGVAGANSYTTVAFADSYFNDRVVTEWTGTDAAKGVALIKATDYMEAIYSNRWIGNLSSDATTLSFPRTSVYDKKGNLVDFAADGIPDEIQKATCEYALRALSQSLMPDPSVSATGQAVKRTLDRIGPIETEVEYESAGFRPDTVRPYPAADRLLKFWLTSKGGVIR